MKIQKKHCTMLICPLKTQMLFVGLGHIAHNWYYSITSKITLIKLSSDSFLKKKLFFDTKLMKASKSFVGPNFKFFQESPIHYLYSGLSLVLDPFLSRFLSRQIFSLVSCNSDYYFLFCSPIFPTTARPLLPSLPWFLVIANDTIEIPIVWSHFRNSWNLNPKGFKNFCTVRDGHGQSFD